MTLPWYRAGLRFSCTQCGNCCTGVPGYVWVTHREIEELASFLEMSVEELGQRYLRKVGARYALLEKATGHCVFYSRGCTVYPARPRQCRRFPFWSGNLQSRRAWNEAGDECPGMDHGRFYPVEEIHRIQRGEGNAES